VKILVTGAAGFIGCRIAVEAARRGYEVIGVDNLERSKEWSLRLLKTFDVPLIVADVAGTDLVQRVGAVEWIVHAAAYIDVQESVEFPELYSDNNVTKTVALAKSFFKKFGSKFLFISSAAVYGEPKYLPIDENHPLEPISPYGASKASAELFLKAMAKSQPLFRYCVLRFFNIYGPGQSGAYAGVVTRFIERMMQGYPPEIYGDGEQVRDFLYVDDAVDAVLKVIELGVFDAVLNIGAGTPISINSLVKV